ncbi:hypothetical protein [Snodgrassella alvi]|uniref:hypothetical protein n=1 Tax=Snodgrassella alvi TaxID=1196083 RepID=UPI000C1E29C7|nr:hypothetical protein [Snodgrassella alvi]PIT13111.1 hypothetical protein BGI33_12495 [Snodgrassella alvi]PIT15001.1 hypothetical protein BGI34_10550 [Snodgrassella alvi]
MLITTNKKELEILSLLSSKINHLGIILQSKIFEHIGLNWLYSNVNTNVIKKLIWLRLELIDQNIRQNSSIFENDIVNIKIEDDIIFLTCSVYSNYGIDNIINYHDKFDDFNMNIFDDIFPMLSSCINEHINCYI